MMWWLIAVGVVCVVVALWLLLRRQSAFNHTRTEEVAAEMEQLQSSLSQEITATKITVPDVFDESRILADLVALASTSGAVPRYIERLKKRSLTAGQIDILNQWEQLFNSATSTIEAKLGLLRKRREYLQLEKEDAIEEKKNEVEIARLEADLQEQILRAAQARHQMNDLHGASVGKSEYEQQMDVAWEKEKVNLLWEIRQRQGRRIASHEALTQWFNDEVARILRNSQLTPEQQTELVRELHSEYDAERERVRQPAPDPDNSAAPEEHLFTN